MAWLWKLTHVNGEVFFKVTDDIAEIMAVHLGNRFNLTIVRWNGEVPDRDWLEFDEKVQADKFNEKRNIE